jgi:hypothetical protein
MRWIVVVTIGMAGAPAWGQHGLIEIGQTIASQLVFHLEEPLPLPMHESMLPGHPGYATEDVPIESLRMMNMHEHIPLEPGSDIRLMLVSIDAGLSLFNGAIPIAAGTEWALGSPHFHVTPLWTIGPGPAGGVYGARFQARDAAGLQTQSAVFEVTFVTVPGPGTLAAMLGMAIVASRRRRVGERCASSARPGSSRP